MATSTIFLTDTFNQWRLKANANTTSLGSDAGDLTLLQTTDKTSLVNAINEVYTLDSDDMENVVDDVTPQLGGHLDLNSSDVVGTGNINITGNINSTGSITAATIAGTVTGVTQSTGDNSLKLATTAYVDSQITSQAASPNTALGGHLSGTISNAIIADNTITSNMIAPGVIVAQDIATNAVNGTHIQMGSDAEGDTLYYNGTDYVRLAKGTAGQVLSMNTGATAPEWSTAVDSTGNAVTMAIALG
jgi:hypothetical protein